MKPTGLVTDSPTKSRQRKWVRHGRLYSNVMWYINWHAMKDSQMKGLNLITCLDNVLWCVTGVALFKETALENAVMVLRQAICGFGMLAPILSDNRSCFVRMGGCKKPKGA